MKILSRGRSLALGLTLVAAGLAAPPTVGSAAAAPDPDPSVVDRMRSAADGSMKVRANPATGEIGFVRAAGARADLLPDVAADSRAEAAAKADAYLDRFAHGFGAARGQLERTSDVAVDRTGWTFTYAQEYRGIPVFGAQLKAHVDRQGDLTSVNGYAAPDLALPTTPRFTEAQARERALAMVRERPAGHEHSFPALTRDLAVRSSELMVYRTGSTRGIQGEAKLAWVLEVWNKDTVRETVIIDAQTGKHLNRWSMIAHALDRELIEAYDGEEEPEVVWSEGDPWPERQGRHPGELDDDHQNELLGAAESYWMFMNTFGYDSWDGEGGQMVTVNNDPNISCPNANWNGFSTNYCDGVTADDTVAHEWAHAYTESTSGLIYQWQSGAMNEAYSDIWGETVDMLNDRHNEGGETPDDTVLRTPDVCSEYTRAPVTMQITAPASVAGPCTAAPAAFGPVIGQNGVTGTAVVAFDAADEQGPSDTDGCSPYTNADDVAGQWAFVDRGSCTFAAKADIAAAAGAIGIVVGNNNPDAPISMSGGADTAIYGVMVSQADATKFKSAGEPVTFEVAAVEHETDDSYRWLSGETDPAFGGAIRDMWSPNCYGDPGKVSDEEYHCSPDDSGGVHSNSGVVNRAFAILVDGFEPGGVEAIGLDKAANLFWYAQRHLLTPTSGFPDLADALETSCAALTGTDLNAVTLGNPTDPDGSDGAAIPETIDGGMTAADCAAVTAAIAETELRAEPVQCNFMPMLEKGTVTCGDGFETVEVEVEDFEDGFEGWSQDHEFFSAPGYSGSVQHPWVTTTDMPDTTDLPGGAGTREQSTLAFAVDPTTGSCAGDDEDESARNGLISPEYDVPEGFQPRMSFAHLMASEAGWDGGNVKVSVNGGDFAEIPSSAWLLNGPGGQLNTLAEGNTNPMAGQAAFTGTDGGELTGSWGTSVVSLQRLGARAGDTVQFRFDFGRDGCNGVEGWYVDDVTISVCEEVQAPAPAAKTTTEVSRAPKKVKRNRAFTVKVEVSSADAVPDGKVRLATRSVGLGTAKLNGSGVATIKVTRAKAKKLTVGRNRLVASYLGNDAFRPSRDTVTVKVLRR